MILRYLIKRSEMVVNVLEQSPLARLYACFRDLVRRKQVIALLDKLSHAMLH